MTKGRKFDYAYDDRGNQTHRYLDAARTKYWEYQWDGEDKLITATLINNGSTVRTVTFKYDPFGRRIEKRVTGLAPQVPVPLTTTYLYDGEDIVLEYVSDGTTTTSTHYVHGPGIDEPLALVRGGQNYFYHAYGLGSVVAISDSSKAVVQRYTYESFGMLTASSSGFENPYTYTGREWDKELGLYYYRARYYDPMEGRFVSKDPIGFAGGNVNLFSYVANSPTGWVDPWGYFPWHGNWGGPDWTAGQNKSWNDFSPAEKNRIRVAIEQGLDRKIIPLDAQDTLYMSHDIAYGDCRDRCANATCPEECEKICFNAADFVLAGGLSRLGLQKPYWLKVWFTMPVFMCSQGIEIEVTVKTKTITSSNGVIEMNHFFSGIIVFLVITLCGCVSVSSGNDHAIDTVMMPGMTITIESPNCLSLSVSAGQGLEREYTWGGGTRYWKLTPRKSKWYGAFGAYSAGNEYNWEKHDGVTRLLASEAVLNYMSYNQLLCAISPVNDECRKKYFSSNVEGRDLKNIDFENKLFSGLMGSNCAAYTDDGLYVSVEKVEGPGDGGTLYVTVYQLKVAGESVKGLPGSANERIKITYSE